MYEIKAVHLNRKWKYKIGCVRTLCWVAEVEMKTFKVRQDVNSFIKHNCYNVLNDMKKGYEKRSKIVIKDIMRGYRILAPIW